MKKFLFVLLVLIIPFAEINAQSGWQSLSTGSSTYLSSVFFNDANTGYIGGNNGYIAKTTNGGNNWAVQTSGITDFVRCISFANINTGFICGGNGAIKKTTNGGVIWNSLSSGLSSTVYSVSAADSLNVFACSQTYVLKSSDGGANWQQINVSANSLLAIEFRNKDTGYVAGQGGVLYKTVNSGLNWAQVNTFTSNNIWDLSFINGSTGWFNAYYGTVRKTFDGGANIIPDFGYNLNFEGIHTINKMIAYMCGLNGAIYKTIDGGLHWEKQNSGTSDGLNEIFMVNSNTGYTVSSSGNVLKTTDGGNNQTSFIKVLYPNGGEIFKLSDTCNIRWTSLGPSNVSIEYTSNNGSSWNTIIASVNAENFSYRWIVPNVGFLSQLKIRIKDTGSSLMDESDRNFISGNGIFMRHNVPELFYYKFNNFISGRTPNYANPGMGSSYGTVIGHTIGPGGQFDSALIGNGGTGADSKLTDSSALYLPSTGWTIGFWVSNINLGTNPNNPVYLFGEATSNFRCYYGGSGGIGSTDTAVMIRMTGANDVRIPVVKGVTYQFYIVWDATASAIKVYRWGTMFLTVPQTTYSVSANGPFIIGGHSTVASSLSSGMKLDELRIYNRTLSSQEIQSTYNLLLPNYMTADNIKTINEIPAEFKLCQNYPNPFNSSTSIKYQVSGKQHQNVKLNIYDILGKEIATPVNENQSPGTYIINWDASNYATGIYFYRLFISDFKENNTFIYKAIKRMLLIK